MEVSFFKALNFAEVIVAVLYARVAGNKKRSFFRPLLPQFLSHYLGEGVAVGAELSVVLLFAFLAFLALAFLVLVVVLGCAVASPEAGLAAGVLFSGLPPPAWANPKALAKASVHARVSNFFIRISFKGKL